MSDDSGNGGSARSPRVRTSHATWSGGATDEQTGPAGEPDDEPAVKQPAGRLLGLGAPSGPPCQLRTSAVVAIIVVSMAMLAAASVIGWSVSYKAGVRSVESIGKSMEQLYPERAM